MINNTISHVGSHCGLDTFALETQLGLKVLALAEVPGCGAGMPNSASSCHDSNLLQ